MLLVQCIDLLVYEYLLFRLRFLSCLAQRYQDFRNNAELGEIREIKGSSPKKIYKLQEGLFFIYLNQII